MKEKTDARKGGRYFVAETIVQGRNFDAEAFSQTAAIRELKKTVRRGLRTDEDAE
jgi:hypothetical protein